MSNWPERTLCIDGTCVGTIDKKGYWSICGKPLDRKQNALQDSLRGTPEMEVRKQQSRKNPINVGDVSVGRVIESESDFGFRLLTHLIRQGSNKNLFISPLSVAIALAMAYNGAENRTKQAMAETLGLTGLGLQEINSANKVLVSLQNEVDPDIELSIANSIWIRDGMTLSSRFIQWISRDYSGHVVNLDFSTPGSAETINKWVTDKTNAKIRGLVSRDMLNPLAILILINAIYFKGNWKRQFEPGMTKERTFTLPGGARKRCSMMEQSGIFEYYENSHFQGISLPYGHGWLNMSIFLPKGSYSIREFSENLSAKTWKKLMGEFRLSQGDIVIPRFKVEYGTSLKDALVALGMGVAFGPDAHFQGMGAGPFWISDVIHKSFAEVNEKGTEAAATTTGVLLTECFGPLIERSFKMIVDHPFFTAICDNESGAVLFAGIIMDPMQDDNY